MAPTPTPKSSEKKQQSLTSFFTPRTANGLAASFKKQSDARAAAAAVAVNDADPSPSRKRPLEEDTDQGNVAFERTNKKSKADKNNIEGGKDVASSGKPTGSDSPQSSARATRFAYDQSNTNLGAETAEVDDDEMTRRRNAELHKRFVKKLGHPDAMAWKSRLAREDGPAVDEDGEGDGDADEDESPAPAKTTKKKGAKSGKLTPMEIQFLDIKRKHMDTILIMEVGYKFRFLGEDARIAAKELSIVCIPGKMRYDEHPSEAHLDRFASASIPVHRLPVHAKRLVAAGHKVGVVRQIETAALKKAGDNRNTPFVRKLTNLYTKGTYIDEVGELDQKAEGAPAGGYLLCITETRSKGSGTDEKVHVGILAVQPATGDIIYDDFEDGFMRSEVETRLLHISPCEFLIVGDLTKGTDKLIQHLSGSSTNVFGDRSRVERVPRTQTMAAEAYSHVTQFYAEKVKDASQNETASALLNKVLHLPEPVTICLSAMIHHLDEYGLEHIFDLTKYFQSFSTRSHMLINGTTLESLEVYRNSTDHTERGSLFWALDKTLTRFGQRLLRKWVGRPLLDQESLEERLDAVQELLDRQSTAPVDNLEKLLTITKVDLERSLIRIYYGKCTRPELLSVLQTLQKIATHYSSINADIPFTSTVLASAIRALPQILNTIVSYLERINLEAARKDDKYGFFREEYQTEDIQDHQMGIAHVEHELNEHLGDAAQKIKKKKAEYVTVAGIEFLIEVPNNEIKNVPASWSKISGTKKVSRFHTPEVVRMITERDQHREALAAACDRAFKDLLAEISSDYQPLRDAVSALASLDCLLSLSKVAAQPGYSKPKFLPPSSEPTIAITQGRHAIAERTLESGYIPFSTTLAHPSPLAHLITGPNMGGKSSYVRALALIVLLAQIGSYVPADAISLTLCDAIHTRTGARDNLFAGESTFMVEVSETAKILRSATPRSLVILDELGRGTSTYDGAAIAQAVLEHVVTETRCLTLFITHYQNLARVVDGLPGVTNLHMKFNAGKGADGDEEITFLYEVGEGVAHRSYGLNVARLARIPKKVIDVAGYKSSEMEMDLRMRRLKGACRLLDETIGGELGQLEHLIAGVEQL
ncbi:Mismatch repair protein msh3 [Conoideocrella luteorostrata]|uniref:DNA mismatch repair protein n=1 Tax=Conoideocrella luteorostrata TaxID=1105319 RepID=A0AAJ0G3D1_9HYPO|nr:Mismatch repair protein msh3 [Conoideocrella luteorostrata]